MPRRLAIAERRVPLSDTEELLAVLEEGSFQGQVSGRMVRVVVVVRGVGGERETDTLAIPAVALVPVAQALAQLATVP